VLAAVVASVVEAGTAGLAVNAGNHLVSVLVVVCVAAAVAAVGMTFDMVR
jgi:hypothetical protein